MVSSMADGLANAIRHGLIMSSQQGYLCRQKDTVIHAYIVDHAIDILYILAPPATHNDLRTRAKQGACSSAGLGRGQHAVDIRLD